MSAATRLLKKAAPNRSRGVPFPEGTAADYRSPEASIADVYAAYHLLLRRSPDEHGLAHYRELIARHRIPRVQIALDLMHSPEFANLHPDLIAQAKVVEEIEVDGFKMFLNSMDGGIGSWIAWHRSYEPEVSALVRSHLRTGHTFVDVGANIGWYSLLGASLVGPQGRVIAVEPNPHHCESIRSSALANGFHVEVIAAAASDEEQWIALQTDSSNGWVKDLGPISADSEGFACSYVVPSLRLEGLAEKYALERVDLIKVDVEGLEPRAFRGAEGLLKRFKPVVVFEWFPDALDQRGGFSPKEPLEILRAHGYAISIVGTDGRPATDDEIENARIDKGLDLLDLLAVPG